MNRIKFKHFPKSNSPFFDELVNDFFNTGVSIRPNGLVLKHPSVNILKDEDKVILEIAAPGLAKSDFKIEVEKDQLIISAEKETSSDEPTDKYSRREFDYRNFKRSFHLPETINSDEIVANYETGILAITLPKKEEAVQKTKAIVVN